MARLENPGGTSQVPAGRVFDEYSEAGLCYKKSTIQDVYNSISNTSTFEQAMKLSAT